MNITLRQILSEGELSYSFVFRVLAPIQNGTQVKGMGLTNTYNANLLEYAIEKHLKNVEASRAPSKKAQLALAKRLTKELRTAVKKVVKNGSSSASN